MWKKIDLLFGVLLFFGIGYAAINYDKFPKYDRERDGGPSGDIKKIEISSVYGDRLGDGPVVSINFTMSNENSFPIKDVVVYCNGYGSSGTRIATKYATVYNQIAARGLLRVARLQMGFFDSQTSQISCHPYSYSTAA